MIARSLSLTLRPPSSAARRVSRLAFCGLLTLAPLLWVAPSAAEPIAAASQAQSTPTEVMVIHATQEAKGSIDPSVAHLPQLTRPPFSAYNTYKLLDRRTLAAEHGKATNYALPNGRTLQITVVPQDPKHYRVTASIAQPSGKSALKLLEVTASPNEPFFVAGQSYDKGGSLVIAITLKP